MKSASVTYVKGGFARFSHGAAVNIMVDVRDRVLNGQSTEDAARALYMKPSIIRRWITDRFYLKDLQTKEIDWRKLNHYLKPEFHWPAPSSPCRAHGAELLYAAA